MEYPRSSLRWADLDESSQVGMRFLIWRPFWDEIIFGLLGIFCAWGLKQKEPFAWKLGNVFGGIMFAAGLALGLSELIVGQWTAICVVTVLYIGIGVIALGSLFLVRKEFAPS
jgi:hypothetical protein